VLTEGAKEVQIVGAGAMQRGYLRRLSSATDRRALVPLIPKLTGGALDALRRRRAPAFRVLPKWKTRRGDHSRAENDNPIAATSMMESRLRSNAMMRLLGGIPGRRFDLRQTRRRAR